MITSSQPAAPADVASHYDELDYFYRDIWGEHVHHGIWRTGHESRALAVRQLVEEVAAAAGLRPGQRVCDIGCGYGATARLLAAEWQLMVDAVTVSPAQHAFALTKRADPADRNPEYHLGDWLANDLPSASFDAAIAIESSEHMPDLARFFQEACRVLKPDGRLVVCAWLSRENPSALERKWLLEPICREGRMPRMGTQSDYCRVAAEAGFACTQFENASRQVASTWPRIAWTFLGKMVWNPRYFRFLFNAHARNRVFALTIFRLWLAYRIGSMEYGIFTFVAPRHKPPFDNAAPAP
jgi:cyclopropane fatty-acyl-phospholipid synthase-like methyltransferase